MVLTFEYVEEMLKCDLSNEGCIEQYFPVHMVLLQIETLLIKLYSCSLPEALAQQLGK